jgi:predicted acylesterase/phospholipase RssA
MACHVYSMSIGSLIGGVYAVGMSVHEMEKIAMEVNWKRLVRLMDFVIPRSGFISGRKNSGILVKKWKSKYTY